MDLEKTDQLSLSTTHENEDVSPEGTITTNSEKDYIPNAESESHPLLRPRSFTFPQFIRTEPPVNMAGPPVNMAAPDQYYVSNVVYSLHPPTDMGPPAAPFQYCYEGNPNDYIPNAESHPQRPRSFTLPPNTIIQPPIYTEHEIDIFSTDGEQYWYLENKTAYNPYFEESTPANASHPRNFRGVPVAKFVPAIEQDYSNDRPQKRIVTNFNYRTMGSYVDTSDELAMPVVVSSTGIITLRLPHGMTVEIGRNGSIRLISQENAIHFSLSKNSTIALIHPSGRVFGSKEGEMYIAVTDVPHQENHASLMYNDSKVLFKKKDSQSVHVLDSDGLMIDENNKHEFVDPTTKLCVNVFFHGSYAAIGIHNKYSSMTNAFYEILEDNTRSYVIYNIRCTIEPEGDVRIVRGNQNKFEVRVTKSGSISIEGPDVYITATHEADDQGYIEKELFVKLGQKLRMVYNGKTFRTAVKNEAWGFYQDNLFRFLSDF